MIAENSGTPGYVQSSRCTVDCHRPTPAQCHCTVCHRTFGGVSAFDKHRRNGGCLHPQRIGLVLVGEVWRFPPDDRNRKRLEQLA